MARVHGWMFSMSRPIVISPDDIVFVDVGGGIGQQCALLKKKYPKLLGRVVL